MRGLDPRIHACPYCALSEKKDVDGRVEPGHDDLGFSIS
ncbi:MAG: ABC transporter [Alphaproteobacteria bacterium HGW-Alphaproteobacteria-12]|nr:MAG: ABC transporter [Alphaproteobacteria bacterium HGW-Alphaproteobacteria-12]